MRKRSKYRPTGVNPQAHLMAIMGASLMSTTDALKRAQVLRLQVEEACGGRATRKPPFTVSAPIGPTWPSTR